MKIWVLFLLLLSLAIAGFLFENPLREALNEGFQSYSLNPYGYVYTGNDPLYFYNLDRYRKPYRWPFKFYQSYPYGHLSPLN